MTQHCCDPECVDLDCPVDHGEPDTIPPPSSLELASAGFRQAHEEALAAAMERARIRHLLDEAELMAEEAAERLDEAKAVLAEAALAAGPVRQ